MKAGLKWGGLALGLGLFGWFIHRAGLAEILPNIRRLGWWMPLVLLPYFLVYQWDTLGWYLSFGRYASVRPGYSTLFRVRWAAESINSVIPTAYLGGEALKVYLLRRRGFSAMTVGTSVVASKTCQILSQVLFIALGAMAAVYLLPAQAGARLGMVPITFAGFGLAAIILLVQRHGMFSCVHGVLSRLPFRIKGWEMRRREWRKLDDQIYAFYSRDRPRFFRTTAAFLAGWLCDSLEVYLVCRLLGLPMVWPEAIAIESFISVAKAVGVFVPAALGVQEAGVYLLFAIFGLPAPAALTYAIIRRTRELFYVLVGGVLLYFEEYPLKSLLDRGTVESPSG